MISIKIEESSLRRARTRHALIVSYCPKILSSTSHQQHKQLQVKKILS